MFSRKRLIATGLVAAIGAFSAVGIASASTTVDIDQSKGVAPSKLPKKSYRATSLNVVVNSTTDNANGVPDPVTNAKLTFDDDVKISTKGLKTCTANLANSTTQAALNACGTAKVGSGTANVVVPGAGDFPAVITAFNGPKQGGKPTLILHGRVDALGVTQILTGTINSKGATGDYATTLTVPINPLPAGAQLQRFEVTVKKGNYITARCHDKNKKLNMKGQFVVGGSGPASQADTTAQTCSIKR
jgi:hypothetical protein